MYPGGFVGIRNADPHAWLREERAFLELALVSAGADALAMEILARTRDQLDGLFSDAAELLPK